MLQFCACWNLFNCNVADFIKKEKGVSNSHPPGSWRLTCWTTETQTQLVSSFFVIIAAFQDESKRPAAFFKTWQEKEIFGLRPVRENLFKCGQIYFLASVLTLLYGKLEVLAALRRQSWWKVKYLTQCRRALLFKGRLNRHGTQQRVKECYDKETRPLRPPDIL